MIIATNSLTRNAGVTTFSLSLAEKLFQATNENVCIVDLSNVPGNISYILEHVQTTANNLDNIMDYILIKDTDLKHDIKAIIEENTLKFKNSKVSVIYGSENQRHLKKEQYVELIKMLQQIYPIIVLDYGMYEVPEYLSNMIDINLLMVQSNFAYIDKLRRSSEYVTENTHFVLNNYSRKNSRLKRDLQVMFENNEIIGELPASNSLNEMMYEGNINISLGSYSTALNAIVSKICKELSISVKAKRTVFGKIKFDSKEDVIIIEPSMRLGDILVQYMNVLSVEQLEEALKIQRKLDKKSSRTNG